MPPVGFEPTISAGERPQPYALDRVATGTGHINIACEYTGRYSSTGTGLRVAQPFSISSNNTNFSSSLPRLVHFRLYVPRA